MANTLKIGSINRHAIQEANKRTASYPWQATAIRCTDRKNHGGQSEHDIVRCTKGNEGTGRQEEKEVIDERT